MIKHGMNYLNYNIYTFNIREGKKLLKKKRKSSVVEMQKLRKIKKITLERIDS